MKILKALLLLLLVVFVIIQLFRPEKNVSTTAPVAHLSSLYPIPADVDNLLKRSCYDCHSNNTVYPWYAHIQPVGWWLADHVTEGKKELNFDEFANYRLRRQYHKLEETIEQVKENAMPLESYTYLHKEADLSNEERATLTNWAASIMDSMKAKYPIDSLITPSNRKTVPTEIKK